MNYILLNSNKPIGVFDSRENVENMINGLVINKFANKSKLSYKSYKNNSICEVNENDKEIISNEEESNDNIQELSPEELEKWNKEKCDVEFELNNLKKQKEKIEESKKTYKVDIDLYKKFKKLKEENYQFDIPTLFIDKYDLFQMLEKENKLNWENFYANYKHKNFSSSYGQIFDNDDARTESNNINL